MNQKWVFQLLPPIFSKKRPKKPKKKISDSRRKIPFPVRDKKWNFPPAVWIFFIFLPSIWKYCWGCFGAVWGCFEAVEAVYRYQTYLLYENCSQGFLLSKKNTLEAVWGCRGCLGIKHSLNVGITSKMEESHILHGKKDTTLDFFFLLRQKCILGRLYPPWVSITALASLVRKDDPRGVKPALGDTSPWGEKKILGGTLFPWRKETFSLSWEKICEPYLANH